MFETKLPIELYGCILPYVSTHDLAIISLVSLTLRREAEPILYRAITLDCRSPQTRILCWCDAINGSSRRALAVRTLSLPALIAMPMQEDTERDDILSASLSSALSKLVNLRQLTLLKHNRFRFFPAPPDKSLPSISPSSIGGFPFRLHDLAGDFNTFTSNDIWRFLSTQPEIRSWAAGSPAVDCLHLLPPNVLPSLSGVHLPKINGLKFLTPRPIERLSVRLLGFGIGECDNDLIHSLFLFKDTLRHLTCHVDRECYRKEWNAAKFIQSVAETVPHLECLVYYKNSYTNTRSVDKSEIQKAVSHFHSIETLHLDLILSLPGNSRGDCDEIAEQFICSCPSLRHISFQHHAYSFPPLFYTRNKAGGVEFTVWDPLAESTLSWREYGR